MKTKQTQLKRPATVTLALTAWMCVLAGNVLATQPALEYRGERQPQLSIFSQSNGQMMVTGYGEARRKYFIQATANLATGTWGKLTTTNSDGGGLFCVIDQDATNYPCRFYRAVSGISLWGGGLTAKAGISFSGGAYLDSYDSSKGAYNPLIHGTNAVALTDANGAGAINLDGGANVYGMAITGPGGTVTTSGQVSVGDTNWVATQLGIEPDWSADDANVQFNDQVAPYSSGIVPAPGLLGGTKYTYLLNGALVSRYYMNSLTLSGSQTMMVTGNVTLYVTGNFDISGKAQLIIAPGSSLNLYLGGDMQVSGQGIANQTMAPINFIVRGLPTCTSISYSGGDAFYGIADAPEAAFSITGGSGAFGAFIGNVIQVSGQGGVHFDESLGSAGN